MNNSIYNSETERIYKKAEERLKHRRRRGKDNTKPDVDYSNYRRDEKNDLSLLIFIIILSISLMLLNKLSFLSHFSYKVISIELIILTVIIMLSVKYKNIFLSLFAIPILFFIFIYVERVNFIKGDYIDTLITSILSLGRYVLPLCISSILSIFILVIRTIRRKKKYE